MKSSLCFQPVIVTVPAGFQEEKFDVCPGSFRSFWRCPHQVRSVHVLARLRLVRFEASITIVMLIDPRK
jgi:hypothetical protein